MIQTTVEGALVERVVRTIRWAAGVVQALPEQLPPRRDLESAVQELHVAARALERLTQPASEERYRRYLQAEGFDVAQKCPPRVPQSIQVRAIFARPLSCPKCDSLDFSATRETWTCERCGHTAPWVELAHA